MCLQVGQLGNRANDTFSEDDIRAIPSFSEASLTWWNESFGMVSESLEENSDRTFRIPFRSTIGLMLLNGPRGLPGFCSGMSSPLQEPLGGNCLLWQSLGDGQSIQQ